MSRKLNARRGYRIQLCSQESSDTGKDVGFRVEEQCDMRLPEHTCGEKAPNNRNA